MSTRNLDLALAGSKGVKVLPDLTSALPNVGDVMTVTSITGGDVVTAFGPPGSLGSSYLSTTGGTMTGPIVLAADPATNMQAATRQYVDGVKFPEAPTDGLYYARQNTAWQPVLPLSGSTMSGPLILSADPTAPLGAATMQYVQAYVQAQVGAAGPFLPLAGNATVTGPTTFAAALNIGSNTARQPLSLNGPLSSFRPLTWQTAGSPRFQITCNSAAEGSGNVGSDLDFACFDNTGTAILNPAMRWTRSTGAFTFYGPTVAAPNAQISAKSLYGGGNAAMTYSGSQSGFSQYGVVSAMNLNGSVTSGTVSANLMLINSDIVSIPVNAQGLGWLSITGNFGGPTAWAASTAYALNATVSNGGNAYRVTTAGTSAASGGPTGTGTNINDGSVVWTYTQPNMRGSRGGLVCTVNYSGTNAGATDSDRQWTSITQTFQGTTNAGGTGLGPGQGAGFGYAGGDQSWLKGAATNWTGIVGREIDVGIFDGCSAYQRTGLQIVSFGTQQAAGDNDSALTFGAIPGCPGFIYGLSMGGGAIDTVKGYLIAGRLPVPGTAVGKNVIPMQAYRGVDLGNFLFSNAAFRAAGGFVVDPQGAVNVSSAKLSVTSAGVAQLDVPGKAVTAVTLNNGSVSYAVGDQLTGPYGTVITVTGINAGTGAITTFTVNVYGGTTLPSPNTTNVPFYGGAGGSASAVPATFNLTFSAAPGTLALNPSGGPITFGGPVTLPPSTTGTATVAVNAGSGAMLQFGDTVAANNVPLCYSYWVGSTSGAASILGSNVYYNAAGTAVRPNTAKNGFFWFHDNRNATNDGSYTLHVVSSSGSGATLATFDTGGTLTMAAGVTAGGGLQSGTTGLRIGGASGPTWTNGAGAPASTQPVGSLYSNTSGASGARLYVSAGGGTWTAIPGV